MSFVTTAGRTPPEGGQSKFLTAVDGTRFRVARFLPGGSRRGTAVPRGTIVLLSGRAEFIEKYFEVISDLRKRGFAVATLDWRGQGLSDRALKDRHKGHVRDFDEFLTDLDQMMCEFVEPNCPAPYHVLCHSMGGNIGLRYLATHPGRFESAIFSAPMWGFGNSVETPSWMRALAVGSMLLNLTRRYVPGGGPYCEADRIFEGNALTQDTDRFRTFVEQIAAESRLELGGLTFGWARQAIRSINAIHAPGFVEAIKVPIRVCTGTSDSVVSVEAQRVVSGRLSNGKQVLVEGAKHELMMEVDEYRMKFFEVFDELHSSTG